MCKVDYEVNAASHFTQIYTNQHYLHTNLILFFQKMNLNSFANVLTYLHIVSKDANQCPQDIWCVTCCKYS